MNALRRRLARERFDPSWFGWLVNPFCFARAGLLRELRPLFGELTGVVLDVGCGRKPYRAFVPATKYVGVDVDTPVTRELGTAEVFYDGRTLPFRTASFDGVLCSQVLEHVFVPEEFLREIARVLKPGGRLLLAVPFAWDEHEQPHDFARYSSFGLRALLERNGFEMVTQRKSVVDARALVQLTSAWLFKVTRSQSRALNLLTQLTVIAPVNIVGGAVARLLPQHPDFYLDNVVLVRKGGRGRVNHYCTYFDRGFLIQGLAMWRSLAAHDRDAVLWVLALDEFTADALKEVGGTGMRVVRLAELEQGDGELLQAKSNRSRVEYCFTLSPCWPRWLLAQYPEIARITYLDADLAFFMSPEAAVFGVMDKAGASVLVTEHRFPAGLAHYLQHGRFNVGILVFRRDSVGLACLDAWREQCVAWCHDRVEEGKYADQKYLDEWPVKLGAGLLILPDHGVNFAPWNWSGADCRVVNGSVTIDGTPLVLFHFARFRPSLGTWWWQSGQLDYGVMPRSLRNAIYGPYCRLLLEARDAIRVRRPGFDFPKSGRSGRNFWSSIMLRLAFGSDWLRVGESFVSGRFGLGRKSGQLLAWARSVRNPSEP